MQIDSAEALIRALRASRLLDPEQLRAVARDLRPFGDDVRSAVHHLAQRGPLTVYQLRKILHGKGPELVLGPYAISDKIGEGGMGRVYRATDTRSGREVALKVVRPHLVANPVIRGRYQREVEAARALRHPNIVGVIDADEAGGRYYMAMEFVDGLDLARLVREHRPLEVVEACEYARQAALGLAHAHAMGFVHRDIKPSNIIVAGERHVPQASEPAVVKVLDMGLVREVGFTEDPGHGNLTRVGTVVGSPDYMAPEQAKNSSTVDHRADIYGLGCTLYFMLVGRPPFPDGTPIEKLIKHQIDAPPPLQALRREIPSEVALVVSRMMARRPGERIQTAEEVADALALLSVYPHGSQPVRIRVWRPPAAEAPDTLSPSGDVTAPPAQLAGVEHDERTRPLTGDHTPHPVAAQALHAPTEADPAVDRLDDGSGEPAAHRSPGQSAVWPWVIAAVAVLVALAVTVYVLIKLSSKPAPPAGPKRAAEIEHRTPVDQAAAIRDPGTSA